MAKMNWKAFKDRRIIGEAKAEEERKKYIEANPWLQEKLKLNELTMKTHQSNIRLAEALSWIEEVKKRKKASPSLRSEINRIEEKNERNL